MPVDIICKQCGKTFRVPPSHAACRKFCDKYCYGEWQSEHCRGRKARHWKGKKGRQTHEESLAKRRAWYKENIVERRWKATIERIKYSERRKEYNRRYAKENKDKACIRTKRYQARKANLPATLTHQEWEEILNKWDHRCAYCGCRVDRLQQEHIIPVIQGGGYTADNIVPACPRCNGRKGGRTPEQAGMSFQVQKDEMHDLAMI